MCSCKGAQLHTLILKLSMGRCRSMQKTQNKNPGSYYGYGNHKKWNRQPAELPLDSHVPRIKHRAPRGEGTGELCAGIISKRELTQHSTKLGAKSSSCTAPSSKPSLQPWNNQSRPAAPRAQPWHLSRELFCTRIHIQSLCSSSRTRNSSLKCEEPPVCSSQQPPALGLVTTDIMHF